MVGFQAENHVIFAVLLNKSLKYGVYFFRIAHPYEVIH